MRVVVVVCSGMCQSPLPLWNTVVAFLVLAVLRFLGLDASRQVVHFIGFVLVASFAVVPVVFGEPVCRVRFGFFDLFNGHPSYLG